jgi:CubicO group peptidase (beta-lactamase class C family)
MEALAQAAAWGGDPALVVVAPGGELGRFGPVTEPRPWASVSKLFAAYAVLLAYEEGHLELDEPAGPPGATVRHLLAHASGLPFEGGSPVIAPGRRRIYSNTGIDLLADLIGQRTGRSFAGYLAAGILNPLGVEAELRGPPSQGLVGDVLGIARLAADIFHPVVIDPDTIADAALVQFPGLDGILPGVGRYSPLDWGLGFEIRSDKAPHWTGTTNSPATFGHFGGSGSFLWVDPVARVAMACLSGVRFGEWALTAWPRLADAVLAETGLNRD